MSRKQPPPFYDIDTGVEAYIDEDGKVYVTLPSMVWMNSDQTHRLALRLLEYAEYLSSHGLKEDQST